MVFAFTLKMAIRISPCGCYLDFVVPPDCAPGTTLNIPYTA